MRNKQKWNGNNHLFPCDSPPSDCFTISFVFIISHRVPIDKRLFTILCLHLFCSFLCFWINQIHPINWIANLLLIEIIYKVVSLVFAHLITDYQIILIIIVRPYIKFTPHLIRAGKKNDTENLRLHLMVFNVIFESIGEIYISTGEETKTGSFFSYFEWIFYGKHKRLSFEFICWIFNWVYCDDLRFDVKY